jgi:hypothetical protein
MHDGETMNSSTINTVYPSALEILALTSSPKVQEEKDKIK